MVAPDSLKILLITWDGKEIGGTFQCLIEPKSAIVQRNGTLSRSRGNKIGRTSNSFAIQRGV
jgi:hypothetical protein